MHLTKVSAGFSRRQGLNAASAAGGGVACYVAVANHDVMTGLRNLGFEIWRC